MTGRIRIGHGYDVHAFGDGDGIVLGGVQIPHSKALLAYSDGDVALHALSDAILGALGLGDIGHHFPDDDPALKGVDSRVLLQKAEHMHANGYEVGNVDVTIIAQRPKLASHIEAMRANIASEFRDGRVELQRQATTTEKLGFAGREEGIVVHAVALLNEINRCDRSSRYLNTPQRTRMRLLIVCDRRALLIKRCSMRLARYLAISLSMKRLLIVLTRTPLYPLGLMGLSVSPTLWRG